MTQRTKLWFRARRYGWGWTPATWQGWVVLAVYFAVLLLLAFMFLPHSNGTLNTVDLVLFFMFAFSATLILIGVGFGKGEKPGWHWGRSKHEHDKTDR